MFIFNFKINGNRTYKIFMGILCIIVLLLTVFICYRVVFNNFFKTNDEYLANSTFTLTTRKLYKCPSKCS